MEGLGGLPPPDLTEQELEVVTTVFRNYETGLREATIYPKVRTFFGTFLELFWNFFGTFLELF